MGVSVFIILFSLSLYFSYNRYNRKYVWSTLEYNLQLPNDPSFEAIDKTFYKEPFFGDTAMHKQTCNIYKSVINEKMRSTYACQLKNYHCSALLKNDTLIVDMCFNTGFTSDGLNITIVKNKYSILPYRTSDNIIEGAKKYYPEIKCQKLVLNKPDYLKEEIIYGSFYLHTKDRYGIVEYRSGEFKCKIETSPISRKINHK